MLASTVSYVAGSTGTRSLTDIEWRCGSTSRMDLR